MQLLVFGIIVAAIIFGPGIWVQRVLSKYAEPADRYAGTGAQLARYLLNKNGLQRVRVEPSKDGDHYDPGEKAVRLTPDKFAGRSLTAITVAAHEVGHALQDRDGYGPLRLRTRLVKSMRNVEKLGAGILMAAPFIGAVSRVPLLGLSVFLIGLLTLASSTVVQFVTLPTEYDASFNRALPILEQDNVLKKSDRKHARTILRAAAYTYVSASLMSLLNIAKWWAILRR